MNETIIVAIIAALGAIIGQWILGKQNAKELYAKLDKQSEIADEKLKARMDVFQADLRTLSNRVQEHNKLIDRTYKLEQNSSRLDERISAINERLHGLESDGR